MIDTIQKIEYFDEGNLGGDYIFVLVAINGTPVQRYEDHYHDKGSEKADGFIDGYTHASPETQVLDPDYQEVAE